ncbi:alpha/beta hydrolase [Enterococcus sp. HY326]|uniref:alpha/beta hydrolase n=1 Tax=Enterococcus sp. HY326 TaxID=2971265 RepID=UPI00223F8161|nr:alpha/beta hydrolase [Enterococcus sp. HY326]
MSEEKINPLELIPLMKEADAKRDAGLVEPDSLVKVKDLSYGPYGIENTFDIYYPKGTTNLLPTIVSIHGGGFVYGDKELYRFYAMYLATQGFAVVNFNYRLAPASQYPAPIEDINNLMNWLLANGLDYHLDMQQLFILGDSAGAQLVEQYTTFVTNSEYAKLFNFTAEEVKPKAVALNCGVYFLGGQEPLTAQFPFYFGDEPTEAILQQFPIEPFITKNFPPAYIMSASHDFLKDLVQPLAAVLSAQGVTTETKIYENPDGSELGHVFHIDQKSAIAKLCNDDELTFFKEYL